LSAGASRTIAQEIALLPVRAEVVAV